MMKIKKKLDCILLVDDDPDDNFFHETTLREMDVVHQIDIANNGVEALAYLKDRALPPELIFLDINMPRMNGWEFLAQYKNLALPQKARVVIMFLTTSVNPEDMKRAKEIEEVSGFETKPLSINSMREILREYFKDYIQPQDD